MDAPGNCNNVEQDKRNEDHISYNAPNVSAEWQMIRSNIENSSAGMIGIGVESSSCSTAFMSDSFCPPIWDQSMNEQGCLGYSDVSIRNEVAASSGLDPVRAGVSWTQNAILGGGLFLPTVPGMLPQSLPHLPADSDFIERAAKFSCFGGGNFGEMMNTFSIPNPLNPHSRAILGQMQGLHEFSGGNGSKPLTEMQFQRHELDMTEVPKEPFLPVEHGTEGSHPHNEKEIESFRRTHEAVKQGIDDEAEFSGRAEEFDGAAEDSFGTGLGSKKRKRPKQDTKHSENMLAPLPSTETAKDQVLKGDQNPNLVGKPGSKHCKQGSQGSDPPKEEYIHVRARRGQATNSHSLAERVRREKISERMKFLQDLVPGCSKVTGKAVMLDEIINYVQSLQRQVEFLSMKLATVNPGMDFNIEGFLAKDIPPPRAAGLSSSLSFPPDMTVAFPPLHPLQPGLIQASLPCLGNASETLRRPLNLQLTAGAQAPGIWEDGLNSIIHLGFGVPPSSQDLSGSVPSEHLKAEP